MRWLHLISGWLSFQRPTAAFVVGLLLLAVLTPSRAQSPRVPPFIGSASATAEHDLYTAVLAGGCFWGVDAVFKHTKGVLKVVSGYAGGTQATANYLSVGTGTTDQAESVQVTFDATLVSYAQLLQIFFGVAHDPTQLNRQGPDVGRQYRSVIFYANDDQQRIANDYIAQLNAAKTFSARIVTTVVPLRKFYKAEAHHQNYLARHPGESYIVINDMPKVDELRIQFPELYQ